MEEHGGASTSESLLNSVDLQNRHQRSDSATEVGGTESTQFFDAVSEEAALEADGFWKDQSRKDTSSRLYLKLVHLRAAVKGLSIQFRVFAAVLCRSALRFVEDQDLYHEFHQSASAYMIVVNTYIAKEFLQLLPLYRVSGVVRQHLFIMTSFSHFKQGVAANLRREFDQEDDTEGLSCSHFVFLLSFVSYICLLGYTVFLKRVWAEILVAVLTAVLMIVTCIDDFNASVVVDKLNEELIHRRYHERSQLIRNCIQHDISALWEAANMAQQGTKQTTKKWTLNLNYHSRFSNSDLREKQVSGDMVDFAGGGRLRKQQSSNLNL